ncbi:MAG: HlyD family efflux transporter periplasmic adaptor subunit [Bacillota bacterium]|nr:HlyD family efflux transporter periplasmic adaptor subunit [Bacillota bacterium]
MTKKQKKAIFIYLALLLVLFIIVEVLPKVTDIFETTQILEPGNLIISYETTGYLIKDESVCIASESGDLKYLEEEGTAVKKGHGVVSVESDESKQDSKKQPRFSEYTERLKGFDGISNEYDAPISGIVCFYIDGYEDYFTFDNMEKIKRETVEGLSYKTADLKRDSVIKGEPIYKISADDNWYILCWVDEETAESYYEGRDVTIQLPDGQVEAEVYKVKKEDDGYRVLFYLDVYYESFARSRAEDMTIVISDNAGLIVKNKCIIEKNGKQGVYVKDKNGDYTFKPVSIIASDDKESVIKDTTFIDEDGNQVYTVNVYDEVLKHPKNALENDLKDDSQKEE